MCCIAVVGDAPCQCFSPGSNQTTSPGRISSTGPPSRCTQPSPNVTIRIWPSGCVCHAVRAPGSNVTALPAARAGGVTGNRGSIRTLPVNHSDGPVDGGCDPICWIFILFSLKLLPRGPVQDFVDVHILRLTHHLPSMLLLTSVTPFFFNPFPGRTIV